MEPVSNVQQLSNTLDSRLKQGNIDVPMLPEVASKVIRLTQSSETDSEDLAKLIQSDQPLAGHVMRIANSALYSPNSTLVSLQQAITRLGMRIIADIALAASVTSKMFNAPGYNQIISAQLRLSLHTGLWSKEIARKLRRNVEASFLAGLLHDIGRPVAIQLILEVARALRISPSTEEVLVLANDYQIDIGSKVVSIWEMPTIVCDVVRWFKNYEEAGKAKEQTMIVVAGALLASFYEKNQCATSKDFESLYNETVFADLNLYQDDLQDIIEKEEQVKSALEAMAES